MKTRDKCNITRIRAISIFAVALVLVLFLSLCFGSEVAFGVSPDGYIENVVDKDLDWYMDEDNINLSEVKSIVDGLKNSNNYDFDAVEPIVIAVLDSGIDLSHELFTGKYDENGVKNDKTVGDYDVLLRDEKGEIVKISTSSGLSTSDISDVANKKHGTHVAGIVATFIHELNLEKYIKILPIRCGTKKGDSATFNSVDVKKAIQAAIDQGADVINMSFAGELGSKAFDIVSDEYASQAVFVAAAGNDGRDGESYPAASKNVIGVMNYTASNGEKILSTSSNRGNCYDMAAPGSNIMSAGGGDVDGYRSSSGTSMSSPIVAFGVALARLKDRAYCAVNEAVKPKTPNEIAEDVRQTVNKDTVSFLAMTYDEFSLVNLLNLDAVIKINLAEDSASFHQYLDEVKPIKLQATTLESVSDGKIEWFAKIGKDGDAVKIGEGSTVEYLPQKKQGETLIYAVYTYTVDGLYAKTETTSVKTITVDYLDLSSSQIRALVPCAYDVYGNKLTDKNVAVGIEYTFTFENVDTSAINPETNVIWYVNGSIVGEGLTFKYTFENKDETYFYARINNQFTKSLKVDFVQSNEKSLQAIEIFSIVGASAIGICIVCVFIVLAVMKKHKTTE